LYGKNSIKKCPKEIGLKKLQRNWAEQAGRAEKALGENIVSWLEPANDTTTYNRSGFSIHGGDTPGSAGCIDLTEHIADFVQLFIEYGKDMELIVKYEN
jgi:hypothetical protein